MAFSGIIKDTDSGLFARGSFHVRLVTFTLFAAVLGWLFTTYIPQISELALRFGAGFGIAVALMIITTNASKDRSERMFAALFFGAGFVAGMWGMWINAQFGAIPTLDQLRASAADVSYDLTLLGEPTIIQGKVFEAWVAVTAALAIVPFLTSLTKAAPGGLHQNPFVVHPDFAQPFVSRLIMWPALSFALAGSAVYAVPYLATYNLPWEVALIPPLAIGFLYGRLHMTFIKAAIIAIVGGIAAAAGFWLPWLYGKLGQDGVIAFVQGTPEEVFARIQTQAADYSYTSEIAGTATDYSAFTLEIWIGLTLAYLCMPLLVILLRRVLYVMRPS